MIYNRAPDGSPLRKDQIPVQDWRLFWPRIVSKVALNPDPAALESVIAGIREEQRTITLMEQFNPSLAGEEYNKRLQKHVADVASCEIAADTPFNESRSSVEHDIRAKYGALQLVLEKRIAENRSVARRLLTSIRDSVSEARAAREKAELDEADSWGVPFLASHPLLVIVSVEKALNACLEGFDKAPPGNPTRSLVINFLPPGLIN